MKSLSLFFAFLLTALLSGAEMRIEPRLIGSNMVVLTFDCSTDAYYQIISAGSLESNQWVVADMGLNSLSSQSWTGQVSESLRYFRVRAVSRAKPRDEDGDGVNDVLELSRPDFFNPLDPSDASRDSDSDGMKDGDEWRFGRDPGMDDEYAGLPWVRAFEPDEGYTTGDLTGQDDWIVPSGNAQIQNLVVAGGQQAVRFGGAVSRGVSRIRHFYGANTGAVVWTDMKIRLLPGPLPSIASNPAGLTAVFALAKERCLAAYDGSSGAWIVATNSPAISLSDWLHLTVRNDYMACTWDLYRDGRLVLQGVGFADSSMKRFARVDAEGSDAVPSYLDDLSITQDMPAFIDNDGDGLTDMQEDADSDGVVDENETDPSNPDSDGDGMDDGQELALGFNPGAGNAFARLPWLAGFEGSEGYSIGALNGQQDWIATSEVTVQSEERLAGENAMQIPALCDSDSRAQHYVGAQGQTVVWVELYAKLPAGRLPDPDTISRSNSAVVAVNGDGILCGYDGRLGAWLPAAANGSFSSQEWTRLTFRLDYRTRTWGAYIGARRVFNGMPFADAGVRAFSRLGVEMPVSGFSRSAYVDSLTVSSTEPANLDSDGDGMFNAWERQYGLDPEAAGDALLDPDQDGLNNADEYNAGTDPLDWDTDGDGVSDGMEVHDMGSNPLLVDITGIETAVSIDGAAVIEVLGAWATDGTTIYAGSRRGAVVYELDVPAPDVYRLDIEGCAHNEVPQTNVFDLLMYIDGEYLGRRSLVTDRQTNGMVCAMTPWLPAGRHTVRIYWDNVKDELALQINRLYLQVLQGPDADGNGRKDWVDQQFATQCGVEAVDTSLVSPACMEGRGRYLTMMTVSGSAAQHGAGDRWYADVPLSANERTSVSISFQNGGQVVTNDIQWVPLNLIGAGNLTIRKGDSLLLTAFPGGAVDGTVTIDIAGVTNCVTTVTVPVACRFDVVGLYTAIGLHDNGTITSNSIQVKVVEAEFNGNPACWVGRTREWECPRIPQEAAIESDNRLTLDDLGTAASGARTFSLAVDQPESRYVIARLGESGPVMANAEVRGFDFYSSAQVYLRIVETQSDGSQIMEMGNVLSPKLDDLTVNLKLIVGGVIFEDGSLVQSLNTGDFDELGFYAVRFVRDPGVETSTCHTLKIFEGDVVVGTR